MVRSMRHSMAALSEDEGAQRSGARTFTSNVTGCGHSPVWILGTRAAVRLTQHYKTHNFRFSDERVQEQRNGEARRSKHGLLHRDEVSKDPLKNIGTRTALDE